MMLFRWIHTGRKHQPRQFWILMSIVWILSIIVYFALMPSAPMFYEYTPASDISATILTAPLLSPTILSLQLCALIPNFIDAAIKLNLKPSNESLLRLSKADNSDIQILPGGAWRPKHCTSRHRVAIVVPYRNRSVQLNIFLYHMHRFLTQQLIDYRIFIIEQTSEHDFNRGALLNIGFVEALKLYNFYCFIFHDVDLLPEKLENMYACTKRPRHMSVAINTMRYNLPYKWIFGGATAITVDQFKLVNGYSNSFFGWGGEDDDMSSRIIRKGMSIMRWDPKISQYYMLSHSKEAPSPDRFPMLNRGKQHYDDEGLNNLEYNLVEIKERELFTLVTVQLTKSV